MRRIAVVGASGTGKTWLAGELRLALADTGQTIQIEDDVALADLTARPASVLLLGLDLSPCTSAQLIADQALRQALTSAALPFQVIYGKGQQRLLNALQALKLAGLDAVASETHNPASLAKPAKRKPWVWACEKCSDPVCEHRLLSDLIAKR